MGWCDVLPKASSNGRVSNHWVTFHDHGNVAPVHPPSAMESGNNAYLLTYKLWERAEYIRIFFSNTDWKVVDARTAGR